jgi:hypothetical protein
LSIKLNVTSNLQTFALIVTAEPVFCRHTTPSDVVVMENEIRIWFCSNGQPVEMSQLTSRRASGAEYPGQKHGAKTSCFSARHLSRLVLIRN